ncbi:MAG: PQQ-dependent sugar dehydrogenase, partial [Flavobacteriales bacterium]|nr:PQQ-dependent sugar dehydrogenase [Flavobacteriales bacterium]
SNGKSKKLSNTYLMRAKLENDVLTSKEIIFKASPLYKSPYHFAARIEFDDDGYLFFTVGDRYKRDKNPQNLENHAGKIHRINDDGSIPEDNPFYNDGDAIKSIWTYGHRNPQGMVYDSENKILWTHEHGPQGGDELNIIKKASNYGWPLISFGEEYGGGEITPDTAMEGMAQPVHYWVPSIAPCGMELVLGDVYPDWEGDILVGSLKFHQINRLEMKDGKVISEEVICRDIGRVRNIKQGPDGYIYIGLERPGKIVKIVPVD